MLSEIRVPKFGMSAIEVEVLEIYVAVGDEIRAGQALVEAAADKVDVAIEAEEDGVVTALLCAVGETKTMGDVLLTYEPR